MGALDVADSDPNIVFAVTGSDGLRSNVSIGKGIYKSEDAGKNWTHAGLRAAGPIGAVVIHPTTPTVVYAAAIGNPSSRIATCALPASSTYRLTTALASKNRT